MIWLTLKKRKERIERMNREIKRLSGEQTGDSAAPGVWLRNGDLFRSLGIKVGGA